MRSRYVAFSRDDEAYLLATWHPDTRPTRLDLDATPAPKWLGLDVRRHEQVDATHALVEFIARYRIQGRAHRMREISRFVHVEGRWLYVDGDHVE